MYIQLDDASRAGSRPRQQSTTGAPRP